MTQKQQMLSIGVPAPLSQFSSVFSLPPIVIYETTRAYCDNTAYSIIKSYLKQRKAKGLRNVTVLDMTCDLGLSIDQINRVLERLKAEKKVAEEE